RRSRGGRAARPSAPSATTSPRSSARAFWCPRSAMRSSRSAGCARTSLPTAARDEHAVRRNRERRTSLPRVILAPEQVADVVELLVLDDSLTGRVVLWPDGQPWRILLAEFPDEYGSAATPFEAPGGRPPAQVPPHAPGPRPPAPGL